MCSVVSVETTGFLQECYGRSKDSCRPADFYLVPTFLKNKRSQSSSWKPESRHGDGGEGTRAHTLTHTQSHTYSWDDDDEHAGSPSEEQRGGTSPLSADSVHCKTADQIRRKLHRTWIKANHSNLVRGYRRTNVLTGDTLIYRT